MADLLQFAKKPLKKYITYNKSTKYSNLPVT